MGVGGLKQRQGGGRGCEKLQMPKSTGPIPKEQLTEGMSCGYGNGVLLLFPVHGSLPPTLSYPSLLQAPGHRGQETFPAFSLWEAAWYQNRLCSCHGEGISESVVCWVHAVNIK